MRAASAAVPVLAAGLAACAGAEIDEARASASVVPADVVVAWNERVLAVAEAEDGFLTLKGVRTAAMMHLAVHDALAAIEPRYAPYTPYARSGARADADPVAAANEAAYAVAVSQYPDQAEAFAAERSRWRPGVFGDARGSGPGEEAARRLGERAAAAVLEARRGDGWDADPPYDWRPPAPGAYAEFREHSGTPEGFVFGVGWARARPFMLDAPDQFRSPPPPDIGSDAYARAFDEVKALGARRSAVRTPDQTHQAMWWKEFVESSHNRLARELVVADGLDLPAAARLFALLNMSVFDGYVATFDNKFFYNHWRPYTAIRRASSDGNPATEEDPDWTNLHDHTYAFPSYPSAHGTVCAAAMTVLGSVFGEDRPFEMTIPEVDAAGPFSGRVAMDPATRSFESFDRAAEECGLSRLYLGIHFRYDSEAGVELGRRVGELAVSMFLRPRPVGSGGRDPLAQSRGPVVR